jgi:serine/threonine protein kinase
MYILLCGYPPFSGNCGTKCGWNMGEPCNSCQELLFHSIQDGQFEFPEVEWGGISSEAKDLICKLLVKDARRRLSAEMVLGHPWLRQGGSSARLLVTPQNIRRNNSARELSAFAESAIAVNRVVLQHMSLNRTVSEECEDEAIMADLDIGYELEEGIMMKSDMDLGKAEDKRSSAKKREARIPFGLSPPSDSRMLQRRARQQSQSSSSSSSCSSPPPSPAPYLSSISCCLDRRQYVARVQEIRKNPLAPSC